MIKFIKNILEVDSYKKSVVELNNDLNLSFIKIGLLYERIEVAEERIKRLEEERSTD